MENSMIEYRIGDEKDQRSPYYMGNDDNDDIIDAIFNVASEMHDINIKDFNLSYDTTEEKIEETLEELYNIVEQVNECLKDLEGEKWKLKK